MIDDNHWLNLAYDLAKKAQSEDEVPIGAVVVKDGKVIGQGYNKKEQSYSATQHAELIALNDASTTQKGWRLIDCTLVVTLEPCIMCLAACQQARVGRVLYGAKDPKGGAISLGYEIHSDLRLNHQLKVDYLQVGDCENILKMFFQEKRKK